MTAQRAEPSTPVVRPWHSGISAISSRLPRSLISPAQPNGSESNSLPSACRSANSSGTWARRYPSRDAWRGTHRDRCVAAR
jgi:hypothetical protein